MIDILMSTFNGAEFLEAQIDSILSQDFREFRLLIRDDGSTDSTLKILERYCAIDGRIQLINDNLGNLGSSQSFLRLLELSKSDLFMLADQDDVWLQGKIASSMVLMKGLQKKHGTEVPLLVFTDLVVCNENLEEIDRSLWKYQHLNPAICHNWRRLLAQNVVTGCTILGNAAARQVSLPFGLDGMFHDHWIAVNAARAGVVEYLSESTVLYRQHAENAEGAKNFGYRYASRRLSDPGGRYLFYRKAGKYFGISANRIFLQKIVESVRRFFRR